MRRVLIALVRLIPAQTPVFPVAKSISRTLIHVVSLAEIVDVRAFPMHQISKLALTAEIEREHLGFAVAAVLKLHAVALGAFGGFHKLPAFIDRHRGRNFDVNMLAAFHGINANGCMKTPRRNVVHAVDAIPFTHLFPGVLIIPENLRSRLAVVLEPLQLPFDTKLAYVAKSSDLHPGNHRDAMNSAGTAAAEPHNADTHLLERSGGEAIHHAAVPTELEAVSATGRHRRRAHPCRSLEKISSVHAHFTILPFIFYGYFSRSVQS